MIASRAGPLSKTASPGAAFAHLNAESARNIAPIHAVGPTPECRRLGALDILCCEVARDRDHEKWSMLLTPDEILMYGLKRLALVLLITILTALVIIVEWPEIARPILPASVAALLPPALPLEKPIRDVHWFDQNWTKADSAWFHHASQGTESLPVAYDWFLALEQPRLSLFSAPGLLSDSAYLARFGFIPDAKGRTRGSAAMAPSTGLGWQEAENDAGLPIGFARTKFPGEQDRIGLTCSACHTGHIEYQGQSIRFDGGPAMLNFNSLEQAIVLSIFYTINVPGRFDRFADRVGGARLSGDERKALRDRLERIFAELIASYRVTSAIAAAAGVTNTPEGFSRLDALNRIGNRLFFNGLGGGPELAGNYHVTDAPVRFPALWTTPWFKWAEYDASIEQPLVRNVGEALGVGARVDLDGDKMFSSSVALDNLIWAEDLLRGSDPFATSAPAFSGLTAPKWPGPLFSGDPAWSIDPAKVTAGRVLYAQMCAGCHLGPINDKEFDRLYPDKAFWTSSAWEHGPKSPTLLLDAVTANRVGTDPSQAEVLMRRTVALPSRLGMMPNRELGEVWGCVAPIPDSQGPGQPFALALMKTVDRIAKRWFEDHHTSAQDRMNAYGPRKNCPNPLPVTTYRARPLDGVWAIAPYLHNGSVPSLDLLLRPAVQRPQKFCLGAKDYDPRLVGYDTSKPCAQGESLFAASDAAGRPIMGNSTAGHSFEDGGAQGVVGRALSDDERLALIEYLKTL